MTMCDVTLVVKCNNTHTDTVCHNDKKGIKNNKEAEQPLQDEEPGEDTHDLDTPGDPVHSVQEGGGGVKYQHGPQLQYSIW